MCLGSQPQAPTIEYRGPSEDDIRRNEESLAAYQTQMEESQAAFQTSLQAQIDAANAETERLQSQYAEDLAAAQTASQGKVDDATAAGSAKAAAASQQSSAQQIGALTVSTQETEAAMPQTTESTVKKNKKPKSLKISTAGVANALGAGVNLGI